MGLTYANLDDRVRELMLKEINIDLGKGRFTLSPRLNAKGHRLYEGLLRDAISAHDDDWLAAQIEEKDCLNAGEARTLKDNKVILAKTPSDAAVIIAEGDFNRYYIRAVCVMAIEDGIEQVEIYRGRIPATPRPESERLVGAMFPPSKILEDLRTHPGLESALGVPAGPHSGLTVRLPPIE